MFQTISGCSKHHSTRNHADLRAVAAIPSARRAGLGPGFIAPVHLSLLAQSLANFVVLIVAARTQATLATISDHPHVQCVQLGVLRNIVAAHQHLLAHLVVRLLISTLLPMTTCVGRAGGIIRDLLRLVTARSALLPGLQSIKQEIRTAMFQEIRHTHGRRSAAAKLTAGLTDQQQHS